MPSNSQVNIYDYSSSLILLNIKKKFKELKQKQVQAIELDEERLMPPYYLNV